MSDDTQRCPVCRKVKPTSDFDTKPDGNLYKVCARCRAVEAARKSLAGSADPVMVRRMNLWRLYKIRPEQYDAMRKAQDYKCAICLRHEDFLEKSTGGRPRSDGTPRTDPMRLHVDHDHETGRIRALLCGHCNRGLGLLGEDPERLEAAARYVREQQAI